MTETDLTTMVDAYKECAIWSSLDWSTEETEGNPRPLDDNYSVADLSPETAQEMADDCADFFTGNEADLAEIDAGQAGHDFWLTRNRHGAGFWDRGLGDLGERLSQAAKVYGECDLTVCEDGLIYGT